MRFLLLLLAALLAVVPAAEASVPKVQQSGRVAVQPFDGPGAPALRAQVSRLLRARKLRVVTSLPAVQGTGQYPELARVRRVAAFVVAGIEESPRRHAITFLVWHGVDGSVAARWSVAASPRKLPRAIAKGFWKHLGPALLAARAPPSNRLGPARPMRIDAGSPIDDAVVGQDIRGVPAPAGF